MNKLSVKIKNLNWMFLSCLTGLTVLLSKHAGFDYASLSWVLIPVLMIITCYLLFQAYRFWTNNYIEVANLDSRDATINFLAVVGGHVLSASIFSFSVLIILLA